MLWKRTCHGGDKEAAHVHGSHPLLYNRLTEKLSEVVGVEAMALAVLETELRFAKQMLYHQAVS